MTSSDEPFVRSLDLDPSKRGSHEYRHHSPSGKTIITSPGHDLISSENNGYHACDRKSLLGNHPIQRVAESDVAAEARVRQKSSCHFLNGALEPR